MGKLSIPSGYSDAPLARRTVLMGAAGVTALALPSAAMAASATSEGAGAESQTPSPTWTQRSTASATPLNQVAYGASTFVAVGGNRVAYSDDGISWTEAASQSGTWYGLTYAEGLFVATCTGGPALTQRAMYSANGIDWTRGSLPEAPTVWESVTWGDGRFVAVGWGSNLGGNTAHETMYSDDGMTWTAAGVKAFKNWRSVAYGAGRFVAVGSSSAFRYSTNSGVDWTVLASPPTGSYTEVTYGAGLFVAVGADGSNNGSLLTSPDGETWTARTVPNLAWQSVTYGNGLFVAVARTGSGQRAIVSTNGTTWSPETTPDQIWYGVTYGESKFVAVGQAADGTTNNVMTRS